MISKEDIKKLSDLARIKIEDSELESLRGEMDSILEYIGQVKDATADFTDEVELEPNFNVMRPDRDPREPGKYTQAILNEAPDTQDGYIKVKKIL